MSAGPGWVNLAARCAGPSGQICSPRENSCMSLQVRKVRSAHSLPPVILLAVFVLLQPLQVPRYPPQTRVQASCPHWVPLHLRAHNTLWAKSGCQTLQLKMTMRSDSHHLKIKSCYIYPSRVKKSSMYFGYNSNCCKFLGGRFQKLNFQSCVPICAKKISP